MYKTSKINASISDGNILFFILYYERMLFFIVYFQAYLLCYLVSFRLPLGTPLIPHLLMAFQSLQNKNSYEWLNLGGVKS